MKPETLHMSGSTHYNSEFFNQGAVLHGRRRAFHDQAKLNARINPEAMFSVSQDYEGQVVTIADSLTIFGDISPAVACRVLPGLQTDLVEAYRKAPLTEKQRKEIPKAAVDMAIKYGKRREFSPLLMQIFVLLIIVQFTITACSGRPTQVNEPDSENYVTEVAETPEPTSELVEPQPKVTTAVQPQSTSTVPLIATAVPSPEATPIPMANGESLALGRPGYEFAKALEADGVINGFDSLQEPIYSDPVSKVFLGFRINPAKYEPQLGGNGGMFLLPMTRPVTEMQGLTAEDWKEWFADTNTKYAILGNPDGLPEGEPTIQHDEVRVFINEEGYIRVQAVVNNEDGSTTIVGEVPVTEEDGVATGNWTQVETNSEHPWAITNPETESPLDALTEAPETAIPIITARNVEGVPRETIPLPVVEQMTDIVAFLETSYGTGATGPNPNSDTQYIDYSRLQLSGQQFRQLLLQNGFDAELSSENYENSRAPFVDVGFIAIGWRKVVNLNGDENTMVLLSTWGVGPNGEPQLFLVEKIMKPTTVTKEWVGDLGNSIVGGITLSDAKSALFGENSDGLVFYGIPTNSTGQAGDLVRTELTFALMPLSQESSADERPFDLKSQENILNEILTGVAPVNAFAIEYWSIPKYSAN